MCAEHGGGRTTKHLQRRSIEVQHWSAAAGWRCRQCDCRPLLLLRLVVMLMLWLLWLGMLVLVLVLLVLLLWWSKRRRRHDCHLRTCDGSRNGHRCGGHDHYGRLAGGWLCFKHAKDGV